MTPDTQRIVGGVPLRRRMEWKTGCGRKEKGHKSRKTLCVALFLFRSCRTAVYGGSREAVFGPAFMPGSRSRLNGTWRDDGVVSAAFTRLLRCSAGAR